MMDRAGQGPEPEVHTRNHPVSSCAEQIIIHIFTQNNHLRLDAEISCSSCCVETSSRRKRKNTGEAAQASLACGCGCGM